MDRLVRSGCEVIDNPYKRKLTKVELLNLLANGVTGLIAGLEPLDRDVLTRSTLQVISRCGAGLSNVDLKAAEDLGIKVRRTPDAPTSAVAELTVGAMITLMRRVPQMDRDLHLGRWSKHVGVQLEGKTVLIIGFGRIGRKVAALVRPFEIKVLAVDPTLQGTVDGVPVLTLDVALPQADVICFHASCAEEILGKHEFKLIKPGTFLLNASRGELVNETCLCQALDCGVIAGAWLDTFVEEPYTGPLTQYHQVILTPHIGSSSIECRRRMEMEAVENLLAAFEELSLVR
ncbi:hypothetical protein MYX04_01305 [Nitrospiraceae bacterium AH_259_D15_M11_P09]|nr:hypothetical protein [Nitrospiraceae bacterium AH_259_D15_M11_P09]